MQHMRGKLRSVREIYVLLAKCLPFQGVSAFTVFILQFFPARKMENLPCPMKNARSALGRYLFGYSDANRTFGKS